MKLVYTGLTRLSTGGKGHKYLEVTEDQLEEGVIPPEENRQVFDKILYPGRPGIVIDIEPTPDGVKPSTARLDGWWPTEGVAAAWTVASEALDAKMKDERRAKENPALEVLRPFRDQYLRLPWNEQPVYLLTIMRYITQSKSARGLG